MASFYPILSLIIVILLSNYSAGQTLTVEKSLVTLPNVSAGTASVYDGDDAIFIFGGSDRDSYSNKILKYSISADNVTLVSQFPWGVAFGTVLAGRTNTSYFYIGGDQFRLRDSTDIFEFNTETMVATLVGALPYSQFAPGAVKLDRDTGLIIMSGNWMEDLEENEIFKFDLETLSLTRMTGLFVDFWEFSTIRDPFTGNVWMIEYTRKKNMGDRKPSAIQPVEKYNPSTNVSEVLYLNFPKLERLVSLTSDGLSCYLIGGYEQTENATILQLNLLTHSLTSIPVTGFPADAGAVFSTSSVYVRKLNRIYMLGGEILDSTLGFYPKDEIFWMDLSPLNVQKK